LTTRGPEAENQHCT